MKDKKILIVDDEANIVTLFSFMLKKEGYLPGTAGNGEEALARMKEDHYPVILLDIMMPKIGGLELLEILKKQYPATQVIMITASTSINTAEKAVEDGAFAYLSKPVKKEEVTTTVIHAFEKYISLKEMSKKKEVKPEGAASPIVYTLIIADYEGKIRKINKATETMLGYTEGILTGQDLDSIFNKNFNYDEFKKVPEKKKVENIEMNFITKDKKEYKYSFSGTIMNDDKRGTVGFVGMLKKT